MMSRIWPWIVGILGAISLWLRGSLAKERADRLGDILKTEKAAHRGSQKASEALKEGLEDEVKPITRNGRKLK